MLNKIRAINWKLILIFIIKFFTYFLLIPIAADIIKGFAFWAFSYIFYDGKGISGPTGIGLQMWAMMAFIFYSLIFYLYVIINRNFKSRTLRGWMLFLFIFVPGLLGGAHITSTFYWAILGNVFHNGSYYGLYHLAERFFPSFRNQWSKKASHELT